MKKKFILVFMVLLTISMTACGGKQKNDTTVSDLMTHSQNNINVTVDNEEIEKDVNLEFEKNNNEFKKNQLIIQEKPNDDGDSNTDNYIILDEDGNNAEVQIGVLEGKEDITDAPDDVNDSPQIINPSTGENEQSTKPSVPVDTSNIGSGWETTYEEYEAMSGTEQTIFYYSFADADEFLEWYNSAKAKYEEENEEIYIGLDGVVNAGEID